MSETNFEGSYVGAEYQCHKRVHAIRIVDFDHTADADLLLLRFEGAPSVLVEASKVRGIEAGGYLVQYADGYVSFSPAKAFEDGYTLVSEFEPAPDAAK